MNHTLSPNAPPLSAQQSHLKAAIQAELTQTRVHTLSLFDAIDEQDFCRQFHPDFSPVGWHLGHIGYTEAFWLLGQCQGETALVQEYEPIFSAVQSVKHERIYLPPRSDILDYLSRVQEASLQLLHSTNFDPEHWLLRRAQVFYQVLQHEYQHSETVVIVQRLMGQRGLGPQFVSPSAPAAPLHIPAGTLEMGDEGPRAYDNEHPIHPVSVKEFWIDAAPVSVEQYACFIKAGGYQQPWLWSEDGWAWREAHSIQAPLCWSEQKLEAPLCHVSAYEAEAYARWVGKRLPTEAEWEQAARTGLQDIGAVWEWTASTFTPYPGFRPYPYAGYSAAYFDGQHRVLRGGSWATARPLVRASFRNWYHPWVRQIFAGFRCVSSSCPDSEGQCSKQ
ncbi:SUMF1/EgtB/PvdO family nonheme iron enzyme [Leptolyngbya sp. FACHB-261]|uniref:SUMF1/EgtB/PvdO family nonheme iron enzyme n=1 Tax=Leptolyngbya sp. FACHB-261 TaxID=2692806 RepID=UPI001686ACBE|nr:SUMF1/EgtB/PvdO family nonheme iron enzyme [Leptolyngbya sp. FACHB-261]MBD2104542.1 ergothioneine biosynthesis protein EgtB [Leptolyngbya sp. FACHB-261]